MVLIIIVGLPESAALEGVELSFRASESLDGLSYAHVGQAGAGIFSSKIKPGGEPSVMLMRHDFYLGLAIRSLRSSFVGHAISFQQR